ncbi:ABC transporter permease [Endozoicomonas sp. OPT23]|nr:ABC transporter permease [Endozoicomonas sp. OPT23]
MRRNSLLLILLAMLCLPLADLELSFPDFWPELSRLGIAIVTPEVIDGWQLLSVLTTTLSFAFQGVVIGAVAGFVLALGYGNAWVRGFAAFIRAIHELFWALIFIQLTGLTSLTGLLALAIPYAGTFAKVFGEIFEESDHKPRDALTGSRFVVFFYTTLPLAWRRMVDYSAYRFECGIRSSVVLGFVGLPTVGFHLESLFSQGEYSQAVAMLYALFLIIGSTRLWLIKQLIPLYVLLSFVWLPPVADIQWSMIWQFFTVDIVPAPLKYSTGSLSDWFRLLFSKQIGPGIANTMILTQLSLAMTLLFAVLLIPLRSKLFCGNGRIVGHSLLVMLRTTPEYLLAFIGVIVLGPSMLPGMLALSIHNAAILAHLSGRFVDQLAFREDRPSGMLLYCYEVLPRIYRQFMALLLYRWEVIQRESAILGILGIPTLGFYIDSAFEEFRLDRAMLLILVTALLNVLIDKCARSLRPSSG